MTSQLRPLTDDDIISIANEVGMTPSPIRSIGENVTIQIKTMIARHLKSLALYKEVKHKGTLYKGMHVNDGIVNFLKAYVRTQHAKSLVSPGETVGIRTGEAIGQQITQINLNTFHFAGQAKTISSGLEMFQEIFRASSVRKREVVFLHFRNKNLSFDEVYDKRIDFVGVTLNDLIVEHKYLLASNDGDKPPFWFAKAMELQIPKVQWSMISGYYGPYLVLSLNKSVMYAHRLTTYMICNRLSSGDGENCFTAIPGPSATEIPEICIFPNLANLKAKCKSDVNLAETQNGNAIAIRYLDHVFLKDAKHAVISGVSGVRALQPTTTKVYKNLVRDEVVTENPDEWILWINVWQERMSGITIEKLLALCASAGIKRMVVEGTALVPYHVRIWMPMGWERHLAIMAAASNVQLKRKPSEYIRLYAQYNTEVEKHTEYVYARLMVEATVVSPSETRRLKIILSQDGVDGRYTISNNPREIMETFGIEACCNYIVREVHEMLAANGITVSSRFIKMIANFMTSLGILVPITSRGAARQNRGVLADASFEHTTEFIKKAAMAGKWEEIRSTSGCIFLGKRSYIGTGSFRLRIKDGFHQKANLDQVVIEEFGEITAGEIVAGEDSLPVDFTNNLVTQEYRDATPFSRRDADQTPNLNPTYPVPPLTFARIPIPTWIVGLIGPPRHATKEAALGLHLSLLRLSEMPSLHTERKLTVDPEAASHVFPTPRDVKIQGEGYYRPDYLWSLRTERTLTMEEM